jgi:YjbE family integral membrane protein
MNGFGGSAFWLGLPQIVLINVLLSGDTAIVIALACRALPPRQRPWGTALGAGTATLLLIVFASVVAPLLLLPYAKLLGGIALLYIAVKLLVVETASKHGVAAAASLWRVVRVVLVADLVLSLDNIIAVASVARGDIALLMIGVAVSIPIILAGAALITSIVDRFPLVVWAGTALLGWIAGGTIATDPVVSAYLSGKFGDAVARHAAIGAAGAATLLVIAVGALIRRRA